MSLLRRVMYHLVKQLNLKLVANVFARGRMGWGLGLIGHGFYMDKTITTVLTEFGKVFAPTLDFQIRTPMVSIMNHVHQRPRMCLTCTFRASC